MIFAKKPSPDQIIQLLSKLKAETPEYPSAMLIARKASFINQAVAIKIDGPKQGGKGGGDGGSSASDGSGALGGISTVQGILLQAVIGVWIIAAMLTASYVFRDKIIDLLQDNGIVAEVTQAPSITPPESVVETPSSEGPLLDVPPTRAVSSSATPVPNTVSEGESVPGSTSGDPDVTENSDDSKDNQGLHLGQTPGAPEPPSQDKPDKPDKPDKSNKSGKNNK